MEEQASASPLKNLTGGGGCGCGCVGLVIALWGAIALLAIPLGFYADAASGPIGPGVGAIVVGILLFLLGTSVYVGSLFLE